MDWILFFEKGIWLGLAALGFAILFNVPVRTLFFIVFLGALGGLTKAAVLHFHISVVLASFAGASIIGMLSLFVGYRKHSPPMVFAIPAVIPMVPGVFTYKAMLGLIHLASNNYTDQFGSILAETVNNGLKALFILLALAAGVALPLYITRRETIKEFMFEKRRRN
ncbi:MAG: threonine/serine exporter family protein [Breznakibacter sp.]